MYNKSINHLTNTTGVWATVYTALGRAAGALGGPAPLGARCRQRARDAQTPKQTGIRWEPGGGGGGGL